MKKYYKTMNWSSYDLPKVLKDRGVDDPEKLPNFHYRDDALKLWHAIKGYITKILSFYYHSDEDIQQVSNKKCLLQMAYYKWGGSWKCKVRETGGLDPLPPPASYHFKTKATHIIELRMTCS